MSDSDRELTINEDQAQEIIDEEIGKRRVVWEETPLSWEQVVSMDRDPLDKLADQYDTGEVPVGPSGIEERANDTPAHIPDPDDMDIESDGDPITEEDVEDLARRAAEPVTKAAVESDSEEGPQRANYAGTPTGPSFDPPSGDDDLEADVPTGGAFEGMFNESGNGTGE